MAEAEIEVRRGHGGDLPGVVALERRSTGAPHWGEVVYRGILEPPLCAEEVCGPRRLLLVAEMRGELAGFAVASGPVVGVVEMESVLVAGELRRRGVGRVLCRAIAQWAGEIGAETVELEVRISSGAGALYRGLGFVEVGRRRRYYRDPEEDAVLMRLEL